MANAYRDQAKRGLSPVAALEAKATAGGLTVEALAGKFLSDYVYLKQMRATRRYEMAIRIHIVEAVGRVLADLLTRDQVRGLMKKPWFERRRTVREGAESRPVSAAHGFLSCPVL